MLASAPVTSQGLGSLIEECGRPGISLSEYLRFQRQVALLLSTVSLSVSRPHLCFGCVYCVPSGFYKERTPSDNPFRSATSWERPCNRGTIFECSAVCCRAQRCGTYRFLCHSADCSVWLLSDSSRCANRWLMNSFWFLTRLIPSGICFSKPAACVTDLPTSRASTSAFLRSAYATAPSRVRQIPSSHARSASEDALAIAVASEVCFLLT